MEDRNGGLLIASRSVHHPASPVQHKKKMPEGVRPSTLASVTDGSEDDRSGEERPFPQKLTQSQGQSISERRKRSYRNVGIDNQEAQESNLGRDQNELPKRAQHDSFDVEEDYIETRDSVLAQNRKSLLLSRLQETFPNGRLTLVRLIMR